LAEYDIALRFMPQDERLRLEAHRVRGLYFVHFGEFQKAVAEYTKAAELSPDDYYIWRLVAIANLASGDIVGHQHACEEMIRRFSHTNDPVVAGSVAETCTAHPESLQDWDTLLPLAELSVQVRGRLLIARTYYRAGNLEQARVNFVEPYLSPPIDRYFLAMAHFRTGHVDDAHRLFAEAEAWVKTADEIGKKGISGPGVRTNWGAWTERPQALALQREAGALIHGGRSNVFLICEIAIPASHTGNQPAVNISSQPGTAVVANLVHFWIAELVLSWPVGSQFAGTQPILPRGRVFPSKLWCQTRHSRGQTP
jgi:tetratricopeptide (TPR) repeat protein